MSTYALKVDEKNSGLRLDVYLAKNLAFVSSRSFVQRLIASRQVTVNGQSRKAHYSVSQGDDIVINILPVDDDSVKAEDIPLDIFYEDDDILIINKPAGLLVHPATGQYTGTLVNALLHHCQNLSDMNSPLRPGIVHRLDKETSGIMVVAKNNSAHVHLAKQFERHSVFKRYAAVVAGVVEFEEGLIDVPLGRHPRHREKKAVVFSEAKEAKTAYRVLKRGSDKTLLALFPSTGRTHQLRVHMVYLGFPILGDVKYGKKNSFGRLALHAQAIGFRHPRTSRAIEFWTKIPAEFVNAL